MAYRSRRINGDRNVVDCRQERNQNNRLPVAQTVSAMLWQLRWFKYRKFLYRIEFTLERHQ